jgi:hypothetical protein
MGRIWKKFLAIWEIARKPKESNVSQSVALIGHLVSEQHCHLWGWSMLRNDHAKTGSHIRKNHSKQARVIAQPTIASYILTPLIKPNKNKDNNIYYVINMNVP